MEDEGVGKAPVTRLRRRLSVEAEDVKSPSAPSTPNKKRGGRLAAKPQLELIDENATENVPKRTTRKSMAKDIIEQEEKPVTPSRRSARIKSNTSIVSDTAQVTDSPRAKRIARRNSQIGSDSEAPSTPVRATRRTRKDSASSIDKQAEIAGSTKIEPVAEIIPEEVESNSKEDTPNSKKANTSIRKSPRLSKNSDSRRSSTNQESGANDNETKQSKEQHTPVSKNAAGSSSSNSTDNNSTSMLIEENNVDVENTPENNISITSTKLLNELETKSKKSLSNLNKSTSALQGSNNSKSKRNRTKSWTTIFTASPIENFENFHSDNESSKKKVKSKINTSVNKSGSGDAALNVSVTNDKNEGTFEKSLKVDAVVASIDVDAEIIPISDNSINTSRSHIESSKRMDDSNESNKENISVIDDDKTRKLNTSATIFDKAPSGRIHSIIIEDSDSNTGSLGKEGSASNFDGDDQCVPVVQHPLDSTRVQDDSCEPMDIDITIPGNMSTNISEETKSASFKINTTNSSRRKSSLCLVNDVTNKSLNKSERKVSLSQIESQNLEKSSNENKSTLILSQIKDISTNDVSTSRSPKVTNNESLKSNTLPLLSKGKEADQKNSSLTYLTSTPLQQKPLKKLMQMNTSIISSKENINDIKDIKNTSKLNKSQLSKSEESSEEESDDESESKNEMFDDEAEEASDDYESGDSRDEEERNYEEENEIKVRGETLDSEEDMISDDSDYEKDSFIVTSDEDDNELLSGSGDDLSLSDRELSMTAKSKKKYNERKEKERKKASREMYEARHNINNSDISSKSDKPKAKKSNRQRLDSTLLDSDNDESVQPKKSNRLRIDSSQDDSIDVDESISKKKKKSKRLSESLVDKSELNKKEITIDNQGFVEKSDPLSIQLKQEPKTPQKDDSIAEVEEVRVDENMSMMKMNETSDPLQATVMDNETSSSSDNNEIIDNYDSMLNELNNDVQSKRAKLWDTSLNLDKKTKQKPNELIVDQLNLTLTKNAKKSKSLDAKSKDKSEDKSITKSTSIINVDEENSSDSIDMRLLFPEDSNDSEFADKKSNDKIPAEDFIPLKRTEAKTDITIKENTSNTVEDVLNVSQKKKKGKTSISVPEDNTPGEITNEVQSDVLNVSNKKSKRKSSICPPEEPIATNLEESDEVKTIVDTTVTEFDLNASKVSLQGSSKKKKNKNKSISLNDAEVNTELTNEEQNDELNVSNKKSKRKSSICPPEEPIATNLEEKDEVKAIVDTTVTEFDLNASKVSLQGSSKKKKNKNKNISLNDAEVNTELNNEAQSDEHNVSNKNSKRKSSISPPEEPIATNIQGKEEVNFFVDTTGTDVNLNISAYAVFKESGKKKKNKNNSISFVNDADVDHNEVEGEFIRTEEPISKKRKRKTSADPSGEGEIKYLNTSQALNNSNVVEKQNKKRKISRNEDKSPKQPSDGTPENKTHEEPPRESSQIVLSEEEIVKKNKKRKRIASHDDPTTSKVFKENSFDDVHVPRLPASLLNQLDDKPKIEHLKKKKAQVTSTTQFIVEETKKKKYKPSNYLEESIHIDGLSIVKKQKSAVKNPKLLQFIPTASTSATGFTTNFRVNPIPVETKFTAQSNNLPNFKNDFLENRRLKKMGTYEMYKRRRNVKLSKF